MNSFTVQLFLGFPVNTDFENKLIDLNPHFVSAYIRDDDLYLQETISNDIRYLGKCIPENVVTDILQLELLESNIYSILNKLLPNHPSQEIPLELFSIPVYDKK
jgi:hypothetical protein